VTICSGRYFFLRPVKDYTKMVQTSAGAANSEWVQFIKKCAAEYHARKRDAAPAKAVGTKEACACHGKAAVKKATDPAPQAKEQKPSGP
jgi:hypothetical protein